ncbi:MAG: LPS-assembly protein LptD, partial [Candidatus Omnitrophica bacterium]|nr:LPS-assembly protein LptD [Candidatus Omnitrophota bacterium]
MKIGGILLRGMGVFLASLMLLVQAVSPAHADAGSATPEKARAATPIQVHGDAVEYFHEEQKVIGTGNVRIDYEGSVLTADKITVYMTPKVGVAEGHVVLKQNGSVFAGDRADYDFTKKIGNVSTMNAHIPPSLYGKARQVEKVSDNHYRWRDGYVTTCCGDSPFYKIQAHQVDVYPGDKVVIYNALLLVRNVPILFIPFFIQPLIDFDRFPVQIIPGRNTEWGGFVLSKWRYQLMNTPGAQSKGNILLDYREKRGVGTGFENFYRSDALGRGALKFYTIEDKEPPTDIPADRNRVQWRHQARVGEATTLTTEVNKLSDAKVIKDFFFRDEYEMNAFPDNYVSLVTAKPEYTFTVLERRRIDDFFNVVERDPELRFDTHTRQYLDTPFYLRQEAQFSNLRREYADVTSPDEAARLDANHTLYYPSRVGIWSVTPRVGTRQTYYSRDAGDRRDFMRGTFEPGVDVTTHFYKTYEVTVKSFGLDYNHLRHIFSPNLSYNYRPNPTVLRSALLQFDSLDNIDKRHFIRFNFENRLQTKEHSGPNVLTTRDILRVIPFFDLDFDTHHLENIGYDVEARPYSWLGFESDAAYDPRTRDFTSVNVDFFVEKKPYSFSLGNRYLQKETSQTTAQFRWQINPKLFLKLYERFEFEEKKSREFEMTLSKTFDCV